MFGKDANWWFGKNSIFGTAISQTKWGSSDPSQIATVGHELNITDEQKMLIGGAILLLILLR